LFFSFFASLCNIFGDNRKKEKVEEIDLRKKASYPDGEEYFDSTTHINSGERCFNIGLNRLETTILTKNLS